MKYFYQTGYAKKSLELIEQTDKDLAIKLDEQWGIVNPEDVDALITIDPKLRLCVRGTEESICLPVWMLKWHLVGMKSGIKKKIYGSLRDVSLCMEPHNV